MNWISQHGLQLVFLGAYLLILALHAVHGQKQARSLDEYLIGGRRLGGVTIALSFYATFVSSVTFVGHAGGSFTRGPSWWMTCVVVFTVLVLVAWFVVAPRFMTRAREYSSLTIPDFLGTRYRSPSLRRLAGLVVVVASVVYMVAVYEGAIVLLGSLMDIPPHLVLGIVFVVVTGYTLAGGFHSVVSTDALQGLILFATALLVPSAMILQKGGVAPLLDSVRAADPRILSWQGDMSLMTMVGLALGVAVKFIVEPRQLSRFYGLASNEQLRRGRWIAPTLLFLTYLCMLPVGFLAHAFIPAGVTFTGPAGGVDTDQVIPWLLGPEGNLLGPVAGAFFLTGLVAAAMSSLDSVLLVAASSMDHDLLAPGRGHQAAMARTRAWVCVLSGVAALLTLVPGQGIIALSSFSGSIYAACFFPALIVGLFWDRATRPAAWASLSVGFAVTLFWYFARRHLFDGAWSGWHEVFVGTAASLIVYIVVSLSTQPEPASAAEPVGETLPEPDPG